MAILDFLKNKEEAEKAKERKVAEKKSAKPSVKKNVEKSEKTEQIVKSPVQKSGKKPSFSFDIIKKPHVSEKATFLAENNQYVFEVLDNCNKTEIKKAVEGIYNVNVLSVNIITIPPKKRRLGKTQGWRKELTKAVVKIKEGQKIEIL
jgi:large subunit ribosomal protein L23